MNQVPLNDCNNELLVNFLEYQETSSTGEIKKFSWVTDIEINENNVEKVMQSGKERWKRAAENYVGENCLLVLMSIVSYDLFDVTNTFDFY